MLNKQFWRGAFERAVKTFAQAFGSVMTVAIGSNVIGVNATLSSLNWVDAASVATFATIYSLITSIGSADFVAGETHDA